MTFSVRFTLMPLVALLASTSTAFSYPWSRTLQQGMSGADVTELQIRVAGWVADCPSETYLAVDGSFGSATTAAVRRYQNAYHLPVTGVVDATTQAALTCLEKADGSTAHFSWSEFYSHDGQQFNSGNVPAAEVKENVRHLMYKLEAMRHKMGDKAVTINSGFRSLSDNAAAGGASNSMHTYGTAADIGIGVYTTRQLYDVAETCGFSGLENYDEGHQHVDSRKEYPQYGSNFWWWESGPDPLNGCFEDPPTVSDATNLLRAAAGLQDAAIWKTWDTAPKPSSDPRGFGDGRISIEDAVRAMRRMKGLEPVWP